MARTVERARDPAIDTIVIAAAWYSYFVDPDPRYSYYFANADFSGPIGLGSQGAARAFAAFEQMVRSFVQQGKTVYIVLQIPVDSAIAPQHMEVCLIRASRLTYTPSAGPRLSRTWSQSTRCSGA